MAEWRFPCFDLLTDTYIASLPATAGSWADVLNDPGSWALTAPLTDDMYGLARDFTGRLLVVAERGGVPVGSGILWRSLPDMSSRTVEFAGAGLMSFFEHFTIKDAATYTAVDQFEIFRDLIATQIAQSTAGDIGLQVDASLSGVLRDRTYEAYSGKTFGALMMELAAVIDGFDWDVRVESSGGTLERWVRTWFPRRGRRQSQTGLRFSAPSRSVAVGAVAFDATNMAATVVASGSTPTAPEGDPIAQDTLRTTASRTDLVAAGWPGYSLSRTWPDVVELETLDEHARAEVIRLSQVERDNTTIDVDPDSSSQPFGSWGLGDEAVLTIEAGMLGAEPSTIPSYLTDDDGGLLLDDRGVPLAAAFTVVSPSTVVLQRRVVGHTWTFGPSSEQLAVTLAPITEAPYVPVEIRHAPSRIVVAPVPVPAAPAPPQYAPESPALIPPKPGLVINGPATASAPAVQVTPYAPARRA